MNRVGLLMEKIGCTAIFDENRVRIPVTLLRLSENIVLSVKKREGVAIIEMSFGKLKNVNKPQRAYFEKLGVEDKGKIREFCIRNCCDENLPEINDKFTVLHFEKGRYIDAIGTSIGKGFAGVMKRHNFSGLRASHGVSLKHRSGGSTGQCQDPGRTIKGKKMAGHMGFSRVTIQNLQVQYVCEKNSLIAIKGSVPGCKGSCVLIRDAIKKVSE